MATITLAVDEELKMDMKDFPWVNWSELAREELLEESKRKEALHKLDEIFKNSELTDEDCLKLGRQLKQGMLRRLKKEGKL